MRAAHRLSPGLIMDLLRWTLPQVVEVHSRQDSSVVSASVS